jgi:hypothetical protein
MSKGERIWNKFSTALTAFFAACGRRAFGLPSEKEPDSAVLAGVRERRLATGEQGPR